MAVGAASYPFLKPDEFLLVSLPSISPMFVDYMDLCQSQRPLL